jgi:glutaredoxin
VYYDVQADSSKLNEMMMYTKGVRKVPVIVVDDKISIGYEGGS